MGGDDILFEDWITYVERDSGFKKANGIESNTVYGKFRHIIKGLCILKQHTKKRLIIRNTWFFLS